MTRHLELQWSDPRPFRDRAGAAIRLLAISDVVDPALADARNRRALGRIDLILGCGDLDARDLAFAADGLDAPLFAISGNHDTARPRGGEALLSPEPIHSTAIHHVAGLAVAGLTWPGPTGLHARRSDRIAWSQALALSIRRVGKPEPLIVVSHIPPLDAGDVPDGGFHRGLHAYRWLMDRVSPRLWLHGHTPLAATPKWRLEVGGTTVVNATGAVLISLLPPDRDD